MVASMSGRDSLEDAVASAFEVVRLSDLDVPARHLERAIGARHSLLFTYPSGVAPRFAGGSLAATMSEYTAAHLASDPLHPALRELPSRFVTHTKESWFDRAAWVGSYAYRDFYRRLDADEVLGLWLTDGGYGRRDMIGMVFFGGSGFVADDVAERLEPLRAPLRQAARRALLFESVERERDVVQVLLARGAGGVDLVHDRHGHTAWLSPRAQRIFASARVPAKLEERLAAFRALRGGRIPPRLRAPVRIAPGMTASVFVVRDVPAGPWICAHLATGHVGAPAEDLTPAEGLVLNRVAAGRTNPAIAEELGVSLETVRTHVKRIFRKLDVKNRVEASLRARDLGLVSDES